MKQSQAEAYLEMMRYQDVDWRKVHIGKLVNHFNQREALLTEMSHMMEALLDIALDHPGSLVEKDMHDRCRELMREV